MQIMRQSGSVFGANQQIGAKHFNIMTESMNIDKSKFDAMIEELIDHQGDSVVDNGASSFLPMMAYIMENDVVDFMIGHGKKVVFHAVLVGGIGMEETQRGLKALENTEIAPIVILENELFGPVQMNGIKTIDSELFTTLWWSSK